VDQPHDAALAVHGGSQSLEQVEGPQRRLPGTPRGTENGSGQRAALETLGDLGQIAKWIFAAVLAAVFPAQHLDGLWHRGEARSVERVESIWSGDRVEYQTIHAVWMDLDVGEGDLRPVRASEEQELLRTEGLPHGVNVVCRITCRI
jgi:hypothetical protein